MQNKLNIPKTINVGFQNRSDTYTGKLAFVVYTDAKGTLRKKKSWDGWRDKSITPLECVNEPTSGFVLNKKVGDYRGGWNGRKAWIRIYDPRGFEFEISVQNLVFILEECSAIKGKGLEGEFVYSWSSSDLVLLPVSSQDYVNSTEFTALQTKKVTKKDMKEGCLYTTKDNEQVMYLGRNDWYEWTGYGYYRNYYNKYLQCTKQHVFVSVDGKSKYWCQKGFTKLATKLGDDPSPLFAAEFEKFKKSNHGAKPTKLIGKPTKLKETRDNWYRQHAYVKEKGEFYPIYISSEYQYPPASQRNYGWSRQNWATLHAEREKQKTLVYKLERSTIPVNLANSGRPGFIPETNHQKTMTEEQLKKLKLFNLFIENEKGTLISV